MLSITDEDVSNVLDHDELIQAIEEILVIYSNKNEEQLYSQPQRSVTRVNSTNHMLAMPGYSKKHKALALKVLTFFEHSPEKNLPNIEAKVFYFDEDTGGIKAIIDGEVLTCKRTAAASAVATKALIKKQAKILAIIGTGPEGYHHAITFQKMFKFDTIRLYNRTKLKAVKVGLDLAPYCASVKVCETVREAVYDADVICTCTNSSKVLIYKDMVKKGAIINCVGAVMPTLRELDDELYRTTKVVADCKKSAEIESGDIISSKAKIYAEIGEIISGKKSIAAGETVIFKSQGIALEDVVAAKIVYENYIKSKPNKKY